MRSAAYLLDLHDAVDLAERTLAAQGGQAELRLVPGETVTLRSTAPTVSGKLPAVIHGPGTVPHVGKTTNLPLFNTADPLDGMLVLLYRGVAAGHHWLALTPVDGAATGLATVHSVRSGAEDTARLIPATVAIDELGPFDAMIPKGYTLNGWDLPTFDLPTVELIAAQVAAQQQDPDYTSRIDIDASTVTVVEQAGTADETRTVLRPDPEGRYPVGSGWWTWQARTLPTVRQLPPPAQRLWFPWARVAALVTHADSTDTHVKVTYPDGRDSAGRGLVLRYDACSATLTSTGLPGWHDRWGKPHTVTDRRIRHLNRPPSGDDRTRTGLIRLRDRFHSPTPSRVPDRADGWLAVDVWDDLPGLHGVPITMCWSTTRRDDLDPTRYTWTPAKLNCLQLGGQDWPGQIAHGVRTGTIGYLARFDAQTVAAMAADVAPYKGLPGQHWIELHGEAVALYRTGGHDNQPLLMEWISPDAEGMYAVAAHQLTWNLV